MSPKTAELQYEIENLPPGERFKLLCWLVEREDLISDDTPNGDDCSVPGIRHTPGVCGGDACVGNTRIPVWTLVSLRDQGMADADLLEDFPSLNAADLPNAWRYAELHPVEIARNILQNRLA